MSTDTAQNGSSFEEEQLNTELANLIEGGELDRVIDGFTRAAGDSDSPMGESVAHVADALTRIADSLERIAASQPEANLVQKSWGNRLGLGVVEDIGNSLSRIANSLDGIHEMISGRFERRLDRKINSARILVAILIVLLIFSFVRLLLSK